MKLVEKTGSKPILFTPKEMELGQAYKYISDERIYIRMPWAEGIMTKDYKDSCLVYDLERNMVTFFLTIDSPCLEHVEIEAYYNKVSP